MKNKKGKLTDNMGLILGGLNVFLALLIPAVYLWYRKAHPGELTLRKF